jgi:hypothetical protein
MQHPNSNCRERDVENETKTKAPNVGAKKLWDKAMGSLQAPTPWQIVWYPV